MSKLALRAASALLVASLSVGLTFSLLPTIASADSPSQKQPGTEQNNQVTPEEHQPAPLPIQQMPGEIVPDPVDNTPDEPESTIDVGGTPTKSGISVSKVAGMSSAVRLKVKGVSSATHGIVLTSDQGAVGDVEVKLPANMLQKGSGADGVDRAAVTVRPGCFQTTPEDPECSKPIPADVKADKSHVTVKVKASASSVMVTAVPAPKGGRGDFTASKLSPVGEWSAGSSTGGFTYKYPFKIPSVAGDLIPSLGLAYSSQAVDGKTLATNNQPSNVGEGWELGVGSIERRYIPCRDDKGNAPEGSGDLCWKDDNAVISYGGTTTKLVKVNETNWRLQADDGSKVERLTGAPNGDDNGEYWKLTQSNGTQVFFGKHKATDSAAESNSVWTVPVYGNHRGDPGFNADFAKSMTVQAWRWNVDYVVDVHGNSMSYFYGKETNKYGANKNNTTLSYVRDGWLARIEYGVRAGQEGKTEPAGKVELSMGDRCIGTPCAPLNKKNETRWPDVPVEQICGGVKCPDRIAPTFFSTKKLTQVRTFINAGKGLTEVDRWDLQQYFPDPGDGEHGALWLKQIVHSSAGADAEAPTTFAGISMGNRVLVADHGSWGNGYKQNKFRVNQVVSNTGANTLVDYSAQECSSTNLPRFPQGNSKRCFPQYWVPPFESEPKLEWFHKYVVAKIVENDAFTTSESKLTTYDYQGAPAWGYYDNPYTDAKRSTWGRWLGYERVSTVVGPNTKAPLVTDSLYYRGRDGDGPNQDVRASITDSRGVATTDEYALRGSVRETRTLNGGTSINSTVTTYDASRVTAGSGREAARIVVRGATETHKAPENGAAVDTSVSYKYDNRGFMVEEEDLGATNDGNDDTCTKATYAQNEGVWVFGAVATKQVQRGNCGSWAGAPDKNKLVSDEKSFYDGSDQLGVVSKGLVTRVDKARDVNGTTLVVSTSRSTFDRFGRTLTSTDALGRTTTTAYAPGDGFVAEQVTTSSPDPDGAGNLSPHVTTITMDPKFGVPIKKVAPAGEVTEATYDNYGRMTQVWQPGYIKGKHIPTSRYVYKVSNDPKNGYNSITTYTARTMQASQERLQQVQIFDGRLRLVQEQAATREDYVDAEGRTGFKAGRLLKTTRYDSRGLEISVRGPVFATGAPEARFSYVHEAEFPSAIEKEFDGAGRVVTETRTAKDKPQATTSYSYGGDRTHVAPPTGSTPTTTVVNARGNTTLIRKYEDKLLGDKFLDYTYNYSADGQLRSMVDPRGVTRSYEYDLAGHRVATNDPDMGRKTSTYDAAGQLVSTTNARNQTLTYTYDAMGRALKMLEGDTVLTENSWDKVKKGYQDNAIRYVAGKAIESKTTKFDAAGRATQQVVVVPEIPGLIDQKLAGKFTTATAYYRTGLVDAQTRGAVGPLKAEELISSYDPEMDRPVALASRLESDTYYAQQTVYNSYGQLTGYAMNVPGPQGSLAWAAFYHDEATGKVNHDVFAKQKSSDIDVETRYERDASLNITKISTTSRANKGDVDHQCFTRDGYARLVAAWTPGDGNCASDPAAVGLGGVAPYSLSWSFDASGNMVKETNNVAKSATSWEFPAGNQPRPHAPVSKTTAGVQSGYEYDPSGNTTRFTQAADVIPGGKLATPGMSYDIEERLVSSTVADKQTKFVYSPSGDQILRSDNDKSVLFLGDTQLELDKSTQKLSTQRTYSFGGRTIAMRRIAEGDTKPTVVAMFTDVNNTASYQYSAASNAIQRRLTTPYGVVRGSGAAGWLGDRGFVDGKNNPQQGVTRLGDRDYDPAGGRFLQPDRLIDDKDPNTWNAYAYGWGDPLSHADPTGKFPGMGPAISGDDQTWYKPDTRTGELRRVAGPVPHVPDPVYSQTNDTLGWVSKVSDAIGGALAGVNRVFSRAGTLFWPGANAKYGGRHGTVGQRGISWRATGGGGQPEFVIPRNAGPTARSVSEFMRPIATNKWIGRGGIALSVVGGVLTTADDLEHGHSAGYAVSRGTGNAAGAVAGGWAGAQAGAQFGFWVGAAFGPAGMVIGAAAGGLIGGLAGGWLGGEGGKWLGGVFAESVEWH